MLSRLVNTCVRFIDRTNEAAGKLAMFLIFPLIGILAFEVISRTFFNQPHIWSVEMAEFTMTSYYILGGAYTLMHEGHARMDLFYSRWTVKGKATADVLTFPFVFFYMSVFLYGSITSLRYAITHKQVSYTSWAPSLTPIKFIMTIGIALMTLQFLSQFLKDLAIVRGEATAPNPHLDHPYDLDRVDDHAMHS